jgi:energy-coupling factor transporter ATP-binding protein EcfA2
MPAVNNADDVVTSEAEALADILAWSTNRPLWQRDALRRLTESEQLTAQDIDELTALCKDQSLPATPLSADHVRAPDAGMPPVHLRAIRDVININALAEGQRLNLLSDGVTIIYGDNGSGKSGYVRILKRACRARGPHERILKNIYTAPAGPQQAQIDFTAGTQKLTEQWAAGQAASPLLSAVSIFDSRTANIHVDETNDVAYTPFPMKLLERLVQACRSVKGKLDAEVAAIEAQTPPSLMNPDCADETAVGRLLASLSERTTTEQIEAVGSFSEDDTARLATLSADLAQDPHATALRLQAERRRLDELIAQLNRLENAASDRSAAQLQALWEDYRIKTEAAQLAARDLFTKEPLPGVGSETWRALWEAARAYSVGTAYPDQPFPVTRGASCVLCQQPLAAAAAERLRRFEAFVQDSTQQDQTQARHSFDQYEANLEQAIIPIVDILAALTLIRDEIGQPELADLVRRFALLARWRLRQLLRIRAAPAMAAPVVPAAELRANSAALELRANALLADEQSEERRALNRELKELTDRRWLTGIKADVLTEIQRKKRLAKLRTALRDTVHTQITNKSSELSESLVTNRLRGRFAQEINRMHIAGLAIELRKTRTEYGVPQFRVTLIHKPGARAGEILSEGEHRCVALAAFLAELSTTDSMSGIVFDDPISSLDHLHRETVAERLAEEGGARQVIVFTHDLPFLFLLERACRERGSDVALRHVFRRGDEPGYCDNTPPMKAQKAEQRVRSLQAHLDNARMQYERDPEGAWLITAKGLLGHLRDTWESAVEGAVAPVLRTFSAKIDTRGFSKLSAITLDDADQMRAAYGRCSTLLHNASDAMNPRIPTPNQIAAEIAALRDWIANLRTRQDQIAAA